MEVAEEPGVDEGDDLAPERSTGAPPSPAALTAAVRARALELGFHAVGFARADLADPEGRLRAWLDRGHAAGLTYMAAQVAERVDPAVLLPGARSVVALSISYHRPEVVPRGPLKVSRYAVSDDYHIVVRKKVRKLRRLIVQLDETARVFPEVDTGPVMERAWAERAGIAWIGKSAMAIHPRLGTYTFLAALITTAELTYDAPIPDRCGSCTACLDACPTGAFVGPKQLDARRCITYWNVEERAAFTAETPSLHGWLAGCDVCQEVCPWNKFARTSTEPRLAPRPGLAAPDPEVFTRPERRAELEVLLRGTALAHTGAEAISRNARVILGVPEEPPAADPTTQPRSGGC